MKKFTTLLAAIALFGFLAGNASAQAFQPDFAKNTIFFEAAGNGVLYTMNFDRRLSNRLSARIGLMHIGGQVSVDGDETGGDARATLVPILMNVLVGKRNHRLELGVGPLFGSVAADAEIAKAGYSGFLGMTSSVAYRYQPMQGGINFRIGAAIHQIGVPLPSISVGYTF